MNRRTLSLVLLGVLAAGAAALSTGTLPASVYGGAGVQAGIQAVAGLGGISSSADLKSLIVAVIIAILDLVTVLALVGIIIAGIYLITSNGDEGQKDKAKKFIIYIIIGILVVLFSRVLVVFISTLF